MTSRRGFAFPILAGLAAGLTLTAPARVDAADACEPLNKAVDRMMIRAPMSCRSDPISAACAGPGWASQTPSRRYSSRTW